LKPIFNENGWAEFRDMKTLERRIADLEARFAVSELRSTYCWYTTRGEVQAVVELFAEDAVFENSRGTSKAPVIVRGRDAIARHLSSMRPGRRIPLMVNEVTRILDIDRAEGTCVMTNVGEDPFCGHYVDEFVKVEEIWRFSARRFFPYSPQFSPSADRLAP
jgi:hypothetical protein